MIVTDLNVLYEAFLASMKGSSWKEEPQRFEIDFLSQLVQLQKELLSYDYVTSDNIQFILHERGKVRCIHGNRIRDRVVRHAFCDNVLTPKIEPYLIYNNGASQKGKGITFARKMFEQDLHNYWLEHKNNKGYVGFIDFSKFYDNIRHDKIREILYPLLSEEEQWLMDKVLESFEIDVSYMSKEEYDKCLDEKFNSVEYYLNTPKHWLTNKKKMAKSVNIGDQISQNLGVFFPTPIDNYAKIVRGCKKYGRYMDDIYIIHESKEYIQSVINGIIEEAAKYGLFVNPQKTRIVPMSSTFKFLQIRYSLTDTGRVIRKISQRAITRERRKLKAYRRLIDKGQMTYEDVENAFKSWFGNFYRYMSNKQIANMSKLYKELFKELPKWQKRHSKLNWLMEHSSEISP